MAREESWRSLEGIVALNKGKLVGKTRLQKTVYLLQSTGVNFGYDFEYHFYGPYSEGVAEDLEWARFFDVLSAREESGFHEVPYTVFSTNSMPPESVCGVKADNVRLYLSVLDKYSAVVLELAATLDYLKKSGFEENAEQELVLRKSAKANPERLVKAKKLLVELGLDGWRDPVNW